MTFTVSPAPNFLFALRIKPSVLTMASRALLNPPVLTVLHRLLCSLLCPDHRA